MFFDSVAQPSFDPTAVPSNDKDFMILYWQLQRHRQHTKVKDRLSVNTKIKV